MVKTPELSERRRKLRKKVVTLRGVFEGSVTDHTVFTRVIFENRRTPLTESTNICQKSTPTTKGLPEAVSVSYERGDDI